MAKRKSKNSSGGSGREDASLPTTGSPMDVRLLEQLVKLMAANDLNTVELRDGGRRVTLKRGAMGNIVHSVAPASTSTPAPAGSQAPASASPSASTSDDTSGHLQIKSPMVGTFYSSPSPDAKPFVAVGSTVDEDTDVCIIEAMKVFNNIKAEVRGTIAKVLISNGQTVEFGQTLFLVKP